jgi:IPT/TIG domain.
LPKEFIMRSRVSLLVAFMLLAGGVHASVFRVPSDAALIDRADAIVIGTVTGVDFTSTTGREIETLVILRVEETIRGDVPCSVTLHEEGGVVGTRFEFVAAAPLYASGERVLVFLEKSGNVWRTWGMALGKFDFVDTESGGEALVRADRYGEIYGYDEDGSFHRERMREAAAFLSFVRAHAVGESRSAEYFLPEATALRYDSSSVFEPATTFSPASFTTEMCTSGSPPVCFPARWFAFDAGNSVPFSSNGQPAGAEPAANAIQHAFAAWNDDPNSNVQLVYAGTTNKPYNVEDGVNAIVFNAAVSSIAESRQFANNLLRFDGQDWADIFESDLALRADGAYTNATFLEEIITHETGHNLGFRHSDMGPKLPNGNETSCDPATMECTSSAIMRRVSSQSSLFGPTLQQWERDAVHAIYPETGPTIASLSVTSGPTIGGTALVLTGTNFSGPAAGGATTVTFGGTAAGVVFVNSTTLNITTPERTSAGAVDVVVTNPDLKATTKPSAYTYILTAATVDSLDVTTGPIGGGTAVTITGTQFFGTVGVTFGGTVATNVNRTGSTTITCTTPAHALGPVDVDVSNGDGGMATKTGAFTFQGPTPTITSLDVISGTATGGTAVTMTGTNFAAGATVTFGGASATGVTVNSATSISLLTPSHVVGAVDVTVTNLDGESGTLPSAFTYNPPPPAITSLDVTSGPTIGGTAIVITGTDFVSGAGGSSTVTFGGTPAGVVFVNSTTLNITTPERASAGAVDVVVTNPDLQAATKPSAFTYILTVATVDSLDVVTGSTDGGTAVTITGTQFFGTVGVTFGGTDATNVNRTGSTTITCTTPAHAAGLVDVAVTNGDGGTIIKTGAFTYVGLPPTIESLDVTSGPATGSTAVMITGAHFAPGATVKFGGASATGVNVVSPTSISLLTPRHAAGVVDVTVTNLDGQAATMAGAFTYTFVPLPNGDSNGDFTVDAGDIVYLLNFLFAGGAEPVGSGDADSSGTVDVNDIFYLINFVFNGGPAPAP